MGSGNQSLNPTQVTVKWAGQIPYGVNSGSRAKRSKGLTLSPETLLTTVLRVDKSSAWRTPRRLVYYSNFYRWAVGIVVVEALNHGFPETQRLCGKYIITFRNAN